MTNVSKTSNRSALLLMVATIILALIAYFLLFQSDERIELTDTVAQEFQQVKEGANTSTDTSYPTYESPSINIANSLEPQESSPILKLLGVVVSDDSEQSSATIESELKARTYYLNDPIASTDVTLSKVLFDRVILLDEEKNEVILMLDTSANDYGDFITDDKDDQSNSLTIAEEKALAKSIGNRPKELEHIVKTTPIGTNEGSDGFEVQPGLNPSLFRSAGFKEGDVLKEINGLDLSIAEQYALAMAAIPNAQTLEFTVIRGGRTITLYLDIPSEGLSVGD